MKFDVRPALEAKGFIAKPGHLGGTVLHKDYTKQVEVAWYGQREKRLTVEVWVNSEASCLTVYYYDGGVSPFKVKNHLNEKRAYNAIADTIKNNGFEI